jgi:hypothetical protein
MMGHRNLIIILAVAAVALLALGATQMEWKVRTLSSGTLYHDGSSSGVSTIPTPSGFPEQGLIQAQGGAIRVTLMGETWLSGSTSFKLDDGQCMELVSGHQVRSFGFVPDADEASGVSCWYNVEGRE